VSLDEALLFSNSKNSLFHFTSAKEDEGVTEIFNEICETMEARGLLEFKDTTS
jgi:hypothetical protein